MMPFWYSVGGGFQLSMSENAVTFVVVILSGAAEGAVVGTKTNV